MEIRILPQLQIQRLLRNHKAEYDLQLVEKTEYYLRACSAEEWAKVFPGRVADKDTFIYHFERNRISLNHSACPWGSNGISPLAPLQETCLTTSFGNPESQIISDNRSYPCLELARLKQSGISNEQILYAHEAKQLAPALNLQGTWDEPAIRRNGLRWQGSKIDYIMPDIILQDRILLPVKDKDNCIRSLIEIKTDLDVVVPLSFAQAAADFCIPMYCNFTFEPSWYLMNMEYLDQYPQATVVITNELGVVLGNKPNKDTLVLCYAFGDEMIPFLKLDDLRYRNLVLLVIQTRDMVQFKQNLQETIALLARFSELDIPVQIVLSECSQLHSEIISRECELMGRKAELHFKREYYNAPLVISKDMLIRMAMEKQIYIPDNLKLDSLGRISEIKQIHLVDGLLDSGSTSVILTHDGVNVSLICGSIVAGIQAGTDSVFPDRWMKTVKCIPVVMTAAGTQAGLVKAVEELHIDMCPLYSLPQGTKMEIEQRLSAIRHKTKANLFIFSGNQILAEQRKMLEVASIWAQKAAVGVLICTNVKGSTEAMDFIDESCKRKFHFIRLNDDKLAYLVKEDEPFSEMVSVFKLVLEHGVWMTEEPTAEDMEQGVNLLPVQRDFCKRQLYTEDTVEKDLKNLMTR